MPAKGVRTAPIIRFWKFVQKTPTCWLWTSATNRSGYGVLWVTIGNQYAHRFIWEHTRGAIPPDLCVLHRCDVPGCVRPDHLFLGTHGDNIRDRDTKGRTSRGEAQHLAKLTAAIVREMRRRYRQGVSAPILAREYGVDRTVAHAAIVGKTWKHL